MNEFHDALHQTPPLDPERAKALKSQAGAALDRRLRRTAWITTLYLMACVAAFLYGWHGFTQAGTTRTLIFYAILMLVAYETTVLIKLWYWVVNNKLTVLKEVKLLRLSMPPGAEASLAADAPIGFRRRDRWLMSGAIVLTALVVSSVLSARPSAYSHQGLTSIGYVTLTKEGDAETIAVIAYRNSGPMPVARTQFHAPAGHQILWYDEQGRALTASGEASGSHTRYVVELGAPVLADEWVRYRRVSRIEGAATRKDDTWTYQGDTAYGDTLNSFVETVQLPAGSIVLSADPEPAETLAGQGGAPILRFHGRRDANEKFAYSITYRLLREQAQEPPVPAKAGSGG